MWVGGPVPPPPGQPNTADSERFGRLGTRIGAALIDTAVWIVVMLPFVIPAIVDAADEADATGETFSYTPGLEVYGPILVVTFVFIGMVAYMGGTPGKLMLGMRITKEDGASTPPGLPKALLRAVPGFLGSIPVLGAVISLGVLISSLVWVNNDAERRSAYDRIAGTRVVYKDRLSE